MSNLKKIEDQLDKAGSLKGAFQLDFVQERFISNYQATTGKSDGQARFANEVFAYMEIVQANDALNKLPRFSHFAALIKGATTGQSFRDGRLYVIPGANGVVKVQTSPAAKREMLQNMVTIKFLPEGQYVLKGDKFLMNKLKGEILVHENTDKTVELKTLDDIVASYQRIEWSDGKITDVVVMHNELVKAKNKSKMQSDAGLWATWPGEAAKKTAINRAFRLFHKYPDSVITFGKDDDREDETQDADYTIPYSETETVDQSSGEIKKVTAPIEVKEVKNEAAKKADEFLED